MSNKNALNLNWYQRFTYAVVHSTEHSFYRLGYAVGSHPKRTILYCWILVIVSALGFLRFYQEKNPIKLWVPPDSKFIKDTEWLMNKFQLGYRPQVVQFVSEDVLTPEIILKLLEVDRTVNEIVTPHNITWNDVCFRIPKVDKGLNRMLEGDKKKSNEKDPIVTMNAAMYCSFIEIMKKECFKQNLLELWDYNTDKIRNLTKEDIIETINTYDKSDVMGRFKNYEELLGGTQRNATGHIISARSLQAFWMVEINFTTVDLDKTGNSAGTSDWVSIDAYEWEAGFLDALAAFEKLNNTFDFYYMAARSFGDISNATLFQDLDLLCLGVFICGIYVLFVISKWNWVEIRVILGGVGLMNVGMAFIAGCGLCSLIGVPYGPVHTSLPFLLLGLGVDDMFVIMACWEELTPDQKKLPNPERIGLMLKHAGVSITITSFTDVLAFIVGSSTILPSLQSYCIYAAVAVLTIFFFAVTFFTACFVLDQERVDQNRNGIIFWHKHENYKPNECSQRQLSNRVFEFVYKNIILTVPGKIITIVITITCLGFSIDSVTRLEQRFDPLWLIPQTTYLSDYLKVKETYFPTNGFEGGIYMGSLNYSQELTNIKEMVDNLEKQNRSALGVISWVQPFHQFVKHNFQTDLYVEDLTEEYFNLYLSMFLFSSRHAVYQANFRFESPLECGVPAPKIIMSSVDFHLNTFKGPEEYLPAMHTLQDLATKANLTTGDRFVTTWSKIFSTWITDELIEIEVIRNLQLALLCVMACTCLLIADIQTCFWIFICVLMTMVNVCGYMQRWGLTIDLVSCIGLELAIGLCVDYATHVGHTFLTIKDGSRQERALRTVSSIGAAVVYGGFSTLIGVFMLSQSEAYTFQSFFKIFLLVIAFGLFHGVIFLPVILSLIGPRAYSSGKKIVRDIELT